MSTQYSQIVKDLCTKSAIGLSKAKPEIVEPLLLETQFLDIISPSFSTRKYCVENDIHSIPLCETCGNISNVNKKDHKLGFNRFCSDACRKSAPKLSEEILSKLSDKEWLYNERIILQKSKEKIAEELGCSYTPVSKWLIKHGIDDVKYNSSQEDFSNTLENYEWLYGKYVEEKLTLRQIGELVNCGTGIVTVYMDKHNIPRRNYSESLLSPNAAEKLNDYDWLYNEYVTNRKTLTDISKELDCSDLTVSSYVKLHNISKRTLSENKLSDQSYKLLNDYDWLVEQYITNMKTTYEIGDILQCSGTCVGRYLLKYGIEIRKDHTVSSYEHKIREYLESCGIQYEYSVKNIISPYELDIYIPSHNVAIEINGVYWHSEIFKESNYHKMKYDMCKDKGIRLIHLYEDDIINKFHVIEKYLKNVFGVNDSEKIYARKCSINYSPDKEIVKQLLDNNHIQGWAKSNKQIALEYNGEIVAVMLFEGNVLTRYCASKHVVGGFSKLIKYSNVENIISFVDLDMFNGDMYFKCGFILDKILPPDYKYVVKDKRHHKFNFRISKFKRDPALLYEDGKTEHELALMNKIYRIYDCGKLRLKYVA